MMKVRQKLRIRTGRAATDWIKKGADLHRQGRFDEAIECYDKAIELDPELVTAWINKAASLHSLGRFDEAIHCCDKAIEQGPGDATAWSNKAAAFYSQDRFDEAIYCCDKAIERNSHSAAAWSTKGISLNNLGRFDEAVGCCDKAIELDPKLAAAWSNKGTTLNSLGRFEEAIRCFDKAIELDPRLATAWNDKGLGLEGLGRAGEAIHCYDKVIELDPRNATVWNNKGHSLNSLGRFEEAIRCFDKAIEHDPKLAATWINKGNVLAKLDRSSEATGCFDRALELSSQKPLTAEEPEDELKQEFPNRQDVSARQKESDIDKRVIKPPDNRITLSTDSSQAWSVPDVRRYTEKHLYGVVRLSGRDSSYPRKIPSQQACVHMFGFPSDYSFEAVLLWGQMGAADWSDLITLSFASFPRKIVGRGDTGGLYDLQLAVPSSVSVRASGARSDSVRKSLPNAIREILLGNGLPAVVFLGKEGIRANADCDRLWKTEELLTLFFSLLRKLDTPSERTNSMQEKAEPQVIESGSSLEFPSLLETLRVQGRISIQAYDYLKEYARTLKIEILNRDEQKLTRHKSSASDTIESILQAVVEEPAMIQDYEYELLVGDRRLKRSEFGSTLESVGVKSGQRLILESYMIINLFFPPPLLGASPRIESIRFPTHEQVSTLTKIVVPTCLMFRPRLPDVPYEKLVHACANRPDDLQRFLTSHPYEYFLYDERQNKILEGSRTLRAEGVRNNSTLRVERRGRRPCDLGHRVVTKRGYYRPVFEKEEISDDYTRARYV